MNELVLKAHPKINLSLDVVGKRENGYHDLKMMMQSLEFYDSVKLSKNTEGINVRTNLKFLPTDRRNIVYKAAEKFFDYFEIKERNIYISLRKMIPVSAGLAGGSTDAAAVLKGLNKLYNVNAPLEELMKIGVELGADVPYCLYGKLALCEGIGEIITPVSGISPQWICLAKPNVSVSTAEIFKSIEMKKIVHHPDTNGIIEAINNNDAKSMSMRMYNVLEEITSKKHSIIKEMESIMLDFGALGSIMSGSGPSVFGIFNSYEQAKKCADNLKKIVKFSIVTKTIV